MSFMAYIYNSDTGRTVVKPADSFKEIELMCVSSKLRVAVYKSDRDSGFRLAHARFDGWDWTFVRRGNSIPYVHTRK